MKLTTMITLASLIIIFYFLLNGFAILRKNKKKYTEQKNIDQKKMPNISFSQEMINKIVTNKDPFLDIKLAQYTDEETIETSPFQQEHKDILMIYLINKKKQVDGAHLLQYLLTHHFKFGKMNIFHRHQDKAGKNAIIFSLANLTKVGTFDLDNINTFKTHGVVLFITLPQQTSATDNFKLMITEAHQLAEQFDFRLLNDKKGSWTDMDFKYYLHRIKKNQEQKTTPII